MEAHPNLQMDNRASYITVTFGQWMWFHWVFLVRRHPIAGNSKHHLSHHQCGRGGLGPSRCIIPSVKQWHLIFNQSCIWVVQLRIYILCFLFVVDRRGESEESGDDETRRRSINGDVDPNQPASTSKSAACNPKMNDLRRYFKLKCKVKLIANITEWSFCCFTFYPKAVCWCNWCPVLINEMYTCS